MTEEIITYEEVLALLSEQARAGKVAALVSLERARYGPRGRGRRTSTRSSTGSCVRTKVGVLLRHRPRSISRTGTAFRPKQRSPTPRARPL